ncbi:hypothetical protein DFR50_10910 [Roseiarcus fermentans]|uniref:Uncharacterized protein n=1 Tax=Roseiarcus fermentans TaxID=1473586 RepID=A0A366FI28_9HYPH|nr:hypothetical protein DFR50_10910 [Roseiarcus fermentans]
MLGAVAGSQASLRQGAIAAPFRISKQILNALADRASIAAERSRFAALPSRYLDDVGMTEADRAAAIGYEDAIVDGWRVVASHL